MKKLALLVPMTFLMLFFTACEKEVANSDNSRSSYYYSMKGQKVKDMKVELYAVDYNETGACAGYFINPMTDDIKYLIEIGGGVSEAMLLEANSGEHSYTVDFEYLGIAYNCDQMNKKPSIHGNGSPVEIQQVLVTKITQID
jgi:hypothetical protein